MFRNRSYVYGIGTGIIVGALLLQVMLAAQSPAAAPAGTPIEEMEPQKLKEQAAKFYQVYEKNVKVYTQDEFDAGVQKKVKEETDKLAAAIPSDKPAEQASPPASSRTVLYVQPHLDATAVSELLMQSGVITDQKAFAAELDKQGGAYKIQIGYHEFQGALTMEQIVKNLISKQQAG